MTATIRTIIFISSLLCVGFPAIAISAQDSDSEPESYAKLSVDCYPSTSTIKINGKEVNTVPYNSMMYHYDKMLPPGTYIIEVSAPKYKTITDTVTLKADECRRLRKKLNYNGKKPIIPSANDIPVYKKQEIAQPYKRYYEKAHDYMYRYSPIYSAAVRYLADVAAAGYAEAKVELAEIYYYGENEVKENRKLALHYYKSAAEMGHPDAMYKWGMINLNGDKKVVPNEEAGMFWINLAAERGSNMAVWFKERTYEVPEEDIIPAPANNEILPVFESKMSPFMKEKYDLAMKYFEKNKFSQFESIMIPLAEAGAAEAQFMLGQFYEKGCDYYKKNYDLAAKWYLKAAMQGHAKAQYQLAFVYHYQYVRPEYKYQDHKFWLQHIIDRTDSQAEPYKKGAKERLEKWKY